MPSPSALRKRLALIHEFEQLVAALEAGDESAIEPATDILLGVALCKDPGTIALILRSLIGVLDSFQGELDRGGFKWTTD